jgi:hypothetical protein
VHKSSIFFGANTKSEVKASIQSILDIPAEALGEKYLGYQQLWEEIQMEFLISLESGLGIL